MIVIFEDAESLVAASGCGFVLLRSRAGRFVYAQQRTKIHDEALRGAQFRGGGVLSAGGDGVGGGRSAGWRINLIAAAAAAV